MTTKAKIIGKGILKYNYVKTKCMFYWYNVFLIQNLKR